LIDRGEFATEAAIQIFDYARIALHFGIAPSRD
jgi:hypothetical protein